MATVTGEMVAENALSLVNVETRLLSGKIKIITSGGHGYEEGAEGPEDFDCQGLVEWCHREAGFPMSYAGVNSMIRGGMCAWLGTIEECVEQFGCVPLGAVVFIWADDGNEPAQYQKDGLGNFNHAYLKAADGWLVHASFGNNGVTGRAFADKTIQNGGPNYVGLVAGIAYEDVDFEEDSSCDIEINGAEFSVEDADEDEAASSSSSASYHTKYSHYKWQSGDTGNGVRAVQTALNLCGYDLDVDGDFGPLTEEAVKDFQSAHDLDDDGIVGVNTWDALLETANE